MSETLPSRVRAGLRLAQRVKAVLTPSKGSEALPVAVSLQRPSRLWVVGDGLGWPRVFQVRVKAVRHARRVLWWARMRNVESGSGSSPWPHPSIRCKGHRGTQS